MADDKANGGDNDYGWSLLVRTGCPLYRTIIARIYSFERKGLQCFMRPVELAVDLLPTEVLVDRRAATTRITQTLRRLEVDGKITRTDGTDDRYGTKTKVLALSKELFLQIRRGESVEVSSSNTPVEEKVITPVVRRPLLPVKPQDYLRMYFPTEKSIEDGSISVLPGSVYLDVPVSERRSAAIEALRKNAAVTELLNTTADAADVVSECWHYLMYIEFDSSDKRYTPAQVMCSRLTKFVPEVPNV